MNLADSTLLEIVAELKRTNELLALLVECTAKDQAGVSSLKPLRRGDRERLAKILPVIREVFGDQTFALWEAYDLAQHDPGVQGQNLALVLRGLSPNACGRLLERGIGHAVNGLRIERVARDRGGNVWRCVADVSP